MATRKIVTPEYLHTPEELAVVADVLTWNAMADASGISANTLSQWFNRPNKDIGGTGYCLRELCARTDHSPPLFLGRVVLPPLRKEAKKR